MAAKPIDVEAIRSGLEYVFTRQAFWDLVEGHATYVSSVYTNSLLLATYLRTLDSTDWSIWVGDATSF